jgi:hypothetical protein
VCRYDDVHVHLFLYNYLCVCRIFRICVDGNIKLSDMGGICDVGGNYLGRPSVGSSFSVNNGLFAPSFDIGNMAYSPEFSKSGSSKPLSLSHSYSRMSSKLSLSKSNSIQDAAFIRARSIMGTGG